MSLASSLDMSPSNSLKRVTAFVGKCQQRWIARVVSAYSSTTSTTRGSKVQVLTDTIKLPGLEFVQVDDVATSDITEALKGMSARSAARRSF